MRRRDLIKGIVGSAAAWPLMAQAQQAAKKHIGVLMGYAESDKEGQAFAAAFREELSNKFGWAEGRNIQIDTRWAAPDDKASRDKFAKELADLQPDLFLSHSTLTTTALLQQTRAVPIVFAAVIDPIGSGFVATFPRPGGNLTGFILMEPTMVGKWLELLKEIGPRVSRSALLFNPTTAPFAECWLTPFKAAAESLAVDVIVAPVHDMTELEATVAAQARDPNSGLIVMPESFTSTHRSEITSLAIRYRLPAV